MKTFSRILAVAAMAALVPALSPAVAQMSEEVKFKPGDYGAMVTGEVTGNDYFDHMVGAKAGQELFAELNVAKTDGDGTVYCNILPPGSDGVAIFNGSMSDGNTARVDLPSDGTYTIRVYLMGNDRDAGKTVSYNLDLSIQ